MKTKFRHSVAVILACVALFAIIRVGTMPAASAIEVSNGDIIAFGNYPQSIVKEEAAAENIEPVSATVNISVVVPPTVSPSFSIIIPESSECRISIANPSRSTVYYGDTLVLHADVAGVPKDCTLVWLVDGGNKVDIVSGDNGKTCAVTSRASGEVTVTLKAIDAQGKVLTDSNGVEITGTLKLKSSAGLIMKIISFFKDLFKVNRIFLQSL